MGSEQRILHFFKNNNRQIACHVKMAPICLNSDADESRTAFWKGPDHWADFEQGLAEVLNKNRRLKKDLTFHIGANILVNVKKSNITANTIREFLNDGKVGENEDIFVFDCFIEYRKNEKIMKPEIARKSNEVGRNQNQKAGKQGAEYEPRSSSAKPAAAAIYVPYKPTPIKSKQSGVVQQYTPISMATAGSDMPPPSQKERKRDKGQLKESPRSVRASKRNAEENLDSSVKTPTKKERKRDEGRLKKSPRSVRASKRNAEENSVSSVNTPATKKRERDEGQLKESPRSVRASQRNAEENLDSSVKTPTKKERKKDEGRLKESPHSVRASQRKADENSISSVNTPTKKERKRHDGQLKESPRSVRASKRNLEEKKIEKDSRGDVIVKRNSSTSKHKTPKIGKAEKAKENNNIEIKDKNSVTDIVRSSRSDNDVSPSADEPSTSKGMRSRLGEPSRRSKQVKESIREKQRRQKKKEEKLKMLKAIEDLKRETKLIIEKTGPPPKPVDFITIDDMSHEDIMNTFDKHRERLDKAFAEVEKISHVSKWRDLDHCVVVQLLDQGKQIAMLKKLSEVYCGGSFEGPLRYSSHFTNVLMPEWVVAIYQQKLNMASREEAIARICAQIDWEFYAHSEKYNI